SRQVAVRNHLREHDEERITAHVAAAPCDLSAGVEHHGPRAGLLPREPALPPRRSARGRWLGHIARSELLPGHPANQPRVTPKFVVQPLIYATILNQGMPAV